jgi:predicted RNA-binding Zn-ribbon protein involved in translation (DUF1610 family)
MMIYIFKVNLLYLIMSNFRIKKKKTEVKNNLRGNTTLDKKHRQKVKNFNTQKKSAKKIEKEITKLDQELKLLDKKRNNFTPSDLERRAEILNLKDQHIENLNSITNNYDEMDYYDKAGDIITDYYNFRDNKEKDIKQSKSILEYLNPNKKSNNIEKKSKALLFEKFCQRIEGVRIKKDDGSNRIKYCKDCKVEKILDFGESAYICPKCGDMEIIILDEDRQIKEYSPYKRLNHFREWLNQFQAKESTEIPESVFTDLVKEINRNRITDLSELNRDLMQSMLKKLGYNHLYEHIPYIINKLSNLPPPKINGEIENNFLKMFMLIQEPWELYKPKGRKNFLSYSYILYKFCELLELDELLQYFPLLKSPQKLMEQDQVWKKFCKFLKWAFYPTFR